MEVSRQLHAPAALPPRKQPSVPVGEKAGVSSPYVEKLQNVERDAVFTKDGIDSHSTSSP
jgi:hypothetical protein